VTGLATAGRAVRDAQEEERTARAALSAVLDPGAVAVLTAVGASSGCDVVGRLLAGDHELDPTGRYGRRALGVDGRRVLESAHEVAATFVIPSDPGWPETLDELAQVSVGGHGGVPVGLWVRGDIGLLRAPTVAVVGSRAATSYGMDVAAELSAGLGEAGVTVVSGAAYGIDAAAHRGALAVGGGTVAVLAGGVDVAYPRGHAGLLRRICEQGALASEVAPGRTVTRRAFLARNRVVAALTTGVVVVEAGARSGARNTVSWAEDLSRVVCGVPGPITSSLSVGPHELVRAGHVLVTSAADVLEVTSTMGANLVEMAPKPRRPQDALSAQEQVVIEAFPATAACSVAAIVSGTGLTVGDVLGILARLENAGFVAGAGEEWRLTAAYRDERGS
jgi:DNA processing protein